MWLATKFGFYSVVQKAAGIFHVWARIESDLENLRRACEIDADVEIWPGHDYGYRLIVAQEAIRRMMQVLAENIDYDNFKSEIARLPGQQEKLDAYHTIWKTLANLQR
jgi:hypothetical protein